MAKIGYIRVSSIDQNQDRQEEALKHYGIEKFFKEKVSAKDTKRPQLQAMLEYSREGDTIYILDFSRLARSTKDLLSIIETLEERNIKLISIKENLDTNTPQGKLMLTMLAAINQFERDNLLERQREGIAIAKNKGIYKGRKKIKKPLNWNEIYLLYMSRSITGVEAMKRLGLKKNIFYNFIKEEKEHYNNNLDNVE